MLERVIEEQARGDAGKAESVRKAITAVIGDNLSSVVPGSPEAAKLKDVLLAQGVWSQYLEVGIGPDAEIFTKAQPLSSVGLGDEVGIHPKSVWNNPEPEIVLVVNSRAPPSAPHSATTSICATSKGAAHCCSAKPKTTMLLAQSVRSFACLMQTFQLTISASPNLQCGSMVLKASRSKAAVQCR